MLKCTTSPGSDQILKKKRVSITFSVPAESVAHTHTQHDCVLAFVSELHGSRYKIGFVGIRCGKHLSGRSEEDKRDGRGMEIKSETKPAKSLHHELGVSLRPRDNDIHPNPHGLGRGRDHVVDPVVSLHAEGQRGIRALREGGQGVTREVTGGKKIGTGTRADGRGRVTLCAFFK